VIDRTALRQQIITATDLDGLRRALVAVLDTQDPAVAEILSDHAQEFAPTDQVVGELCDAVIAHLRDLDNLRDLHGHPYHLGTQEREEMEYALMDAFPVTEV
jgi:hypothetical protein